MSKFNAKVTPDTSHTYEGGKLYAKDTETKWVNALCSSFLADGYYEDSAQRQERFVELTREMVKLRGVGFVAKAAIFARNELGMRSVSALAAAIANDYQFDGKRRFYANYFRRPDDVAEVFAAIDSIGDKRSHGLIRGACDYMSGLSEHSLGKYKMKGHDYEMGDIISVTHAHSDAIQKFEDGTLTVPDTWETAMAKSKTKEERDAQWQRLVKWRHLGYLALLRNLRKICDAAPDVSWLEEYLVPQLVDKVAIKKSLVFPYQIYAAYKALGDGIPACLLPALDEAFRASVSSMPTLSGSNLLVLDVSGSMEQPMGFRGAMSIKETSACYCAALYISNPEARFIKFGDDAKACSYPRTNNVFSIIKKMCDNEDCGCGTNIVPVFESLDRPYDRLFLFSDMQVMNDNRYSWLYYFNGDSKTSMSALKEYSKKFGRSRVFSFDLGDYHEAVENPNSDYFFQFTALNDKVFKFIELADHKVSVADFIDRYSY